RHTRFKCDWSSDVCSSDLYIVGPDNDGIFPPTPGANPDPGGCCVHNRLIKIDTLQSTNNGIVYIASTNGQPNAVTVNSQGNAFRSEERRVGKERSAR